jgi:hypothetical protein
MESGHSQPDSLAQKQIRSLTKALRSHSSIEESLHLTGNGSRKGVWSEADIVSKNLSYSSARGVTSVFGVSALQSFRVVKKGHGHPARDSIETRLPTKRPVRSLLSSAHIAAGVTLERREAYATTGPLKCVCASVRKCETRQR